MKTLPPSTERRRGGSEPSPRAARGRGDAPLKTWWLFLSSVWRPPHSFLSSRRVGGSSSPAARLTGRLPVSGDEREGGGGKAPHRLALQLALLKGHPPAPREHFWHLALTFNPQRGIQPWLTFASHKQSRAERWCSNPFFWSPDEQEKSENEIKTLQEEANTCSIPGRSPIIPVRTHFRSVVDEV